MEFGRFPYKILVSAIAIFIGALHNDYVAELFENDRHFSYLSEIEREMSFRTEMGMYYYYYKVIIEAPNWYEGFLQIRNDTSSQYPKKIDAPKTYNLFPEIVIGFLYHQARAFGLLERPKCWQIERGEGLSTVTSCQGLAVPSYFYLEFVWIFSTLTAGMLFIYATRLSGTILGGLIAVVCFLFNHTECTRVQWTPPLRESFAYPIILSQMYGVTMILNKYQKTNSSYEFDPRKLFTNLSLIGVVILTTGSLACWQFSQFILITQIIALRILQWMGIIPHSLTIQLITAYLLSIGIFTLIGNLNSVILLLSLTSSVLHSTVLIRRLENHFGQKMLIIIDIISTIPLTYFNKVCFTFTPDDYSHVYNILKAKFTNYKDFHTLLYTCSTTFDFLPYDTYEAIIKTLLLPTAILAGFMAIYCWYRNYKIVNYPQCIEADVAYNALQTGAFIIMAVTIMRLKLLMNPHLCIIAGLVANKKYLIKLGFKNELFRYLLVITLISLMSHKGFERVQEEGRHYGEFRNIEQEQLFGWIKTNTMKNAVFAGKMSIMANLLLSTRRPIVNNPYYESNELKDRTLAVYEMYSRKDAATVYETLRNMHVGYLVLEEGSCYGHGNAKTGCRMVDLWDVTDGGRAKRLGKRPLCPILYAGNCHPFKRVFQNNHYVVLSLDYSTYIELKPVTPMLLQS